jgi:hypothetical protein
MINQTPSTPQRFPNSPIVTSRVVAAGNGPINQVNVNDQSIQH